MLEPAATARPLHRVRNLAVQRRDTTDVAAMTGTLTTDQEEKLTTLLRKVERASSPTEAVWLSEEDREEVAEIRRTIND